MYFTNISSSSSMVVKSLKVGIGTDSPNNKFEVKADNGDGIVLRNSSNSQRGRLIVSNSGMDILI